MKKLKLPTHQCLVLHEYVASNNFSKKLEKQLKNIKIVIRKLERTIIQDSNYILYSYNITALSINWKSNGKYKNPYSQIRKGLFAASVLYEIPNTAATGVACATCASEDELYWSKNVK